MEKLTPGETPKRTDNVVITCMDFRFQKSVKRILAENNQIDIDEVDRLSIGGPSKAIAEGVFTTSLQIALEKHGAKNVYIFDHLDCGGFGGLEAFDGSPEKEVQAHFEAFDRAHEVLGKVLPEMVVVSYLVGLDGNPVQR